MTLQYLWVCDDYNFLSAYQKTVNDSLVEVEERFINNYRIKTYFHNGQHVTEIWVFSHEIDKDKFLV